MSQQQTLDYEMVEGDQKNNTPLEWVAPIAEVYGGFDVDVCASDTSDLARNNIRNSGGLSVDWEDHSTIWCNHPFGRGEPSKWLRAAYNSRSTVVTLSKADPSADWFGQYILKADVICFPDERVQFNGYDYYASFPVVFAVFGDVPDGIDRLFEKWGWVVYP